ncbi:DUF3135 domain-containing protein [Desulfopila inferna]|uniref:DUF3135 domain-containing protein n=1 Tax=Desulfopila inferna TaxID=468528 RepID=UPI001966C548|nr:DUF3135 domain-containing protein [Desulfopila inferna]MBM9606323.1 DUF3135 domain-containing protein [Desulfopila inferna]
MEMNSIADWEEWVKLARQNPEKFERERKAAIEELIMSQPAQYRHRSRQLQWKIDAVRRTSPNALSSCIRIHDMLMDSFYGPNGLLQAINLLGNADGGEAARTSCPTKAGRCIEFHKKKSS